MKKNYLKLKNAAKFLRMPLVIFLLLIFTYQGVRAQDFTADQASDWDIFPVGFLAVSEIDDPDAEDGSAIQITTETSTEEWFNALAQNFQSETPPVVNGDTYTVSFKHKATTARQIRVKVIGRPTDTFGPDDNTYYDEFLSVSPFYQDFSYTFVSNDTVAGSVHVQLFVGGNDTPVVIDDFEINLGDGGTGAGEEPFEDNDKWNTYREGDLIQEIVPDEDAVNGQAFRISPQTSIADKEWFDTGFQILQDAAVREEAGQSYTISFRYRADADRQYRLSLLSRPLDTFGSDDSTYFNEFLQATTDYQTFEITVTSPATVPSAIYIGYLVGGDDTPLYIDDIQIAESGPTREPTTLYVRQDGDDSNPGTENSASGAWRTITYALSQLVAGDELLLADGLYQENGLTVRNLRGTSDRVTTVRSINKWGAKIEGTTQFETIFRILDSDYVVVDGIEVFNNNNVEFEDWNAGVQAFGSNHVTIKNVFAHDCGCNGISAREGDYFTIENNIVRDNAKTNPFNCSGISVYQPINLDDEPGFHIIIRNNVAFENECRLPFTPLGFDVPTDGNGIILDDFNQTQSEGVAPFTAASLVENNLSFNNGGAGIKIFEVQNATVRNNTTWHNNYVLQEFSSGIGEIGLQAVTGEMTVSNNIAVKIFQQAGHGLFLQTADSGSASFSNNIVVGSNSFEGNTPVLQDNITVSDNQQSFPRFANATTAITYADIADFKAYFGLRDGSPALDAANPDLAADIDLDGTDRPIGAVADIGAYEGIQEGTGPLPTDGTLVAESESTATEISVDGIRDGAYIGANYAITKKKDAAAIADDQDLSASWTTLWNEEYLYVLVEVTDDDLRNDSESSENDDSVELYLDGDNARDSTIASDDFAFRVGWNDENEVSEITGKDADGVLASVSDTETGYTVEIEVPWNKLAVVPSDSLRIGLDVHINDDDEGGERSAKLVWQDVLEDFSNIPSRFGELLLRDTPPLPEIGEIDSAPTVDGTAEDLWDDVPAVAIANVLGDSIAGTQDLSANWKSVYDSENLYFFISVLDDDLRNDSENWFEDDGVEIYIDADNSKNTTYGDNDYQITIGWNNDNLVDDIKDNLGEGSVAQVVDTEGGYDVEVALPWSALGVDPADGKFLGLDVHVNDDDEGGPRSGKLAWFATADESFRNPATFGNVFLVAAGQMPPPTGEALGEIGNSIATHEWTKVPYNNFYEDPIVVMGPLGTGGNQPATVHVRNVGGDRFQWRVAEWNYLDGLHNPEKAGYIVVDAGSYTLDNGTQVVADKTRATTSWKRVDFPEAFSQVPVVMPQLTNPKSKYTLDVRIRNVTTSGFELRVQGEEKNDSKLKNIRERVGYIAMTLDTVASSETGPYEIGTTPNAITERNFELRFLQAYTNGERIFLGHDQTTNGGDPGNIRYRSDSLTASGVQLFFQEERSKDTEIVHVAETFGYAIFNMPGNLTGTKINEGDEAPDTDASASFEIKIYPNPAQNNLVLSFSKDMGEEEGEITIFNLLGKKVLQQIYNGFETGMDISGLERGLYVVHVEIEGRTLRKMLMKN